MNTPVSPYVTLAELFSRIAADADLLRQITETGERILAALTSGHTLLVAGNGGSAGEAQHYSAEIVGRYQRDRRGYPAIALTTDSSALTAIGNDYGFHSVFARQVEALGGPGDIFIALSTSGNSENLVVALGAARKKGLVSIAFLGKGGGKIAPLVDLAIVVPSDETPRIQEAHLAILHAICEMLDARLP